MAVDAWDRALTSTVGFTNRLKGLDQLLLRVGRGLVDTIYPMECAGCGNTGKIICGKCTDRLPWLGDSRCQVCSMPTAERLCLRCAETQRSFDGIRAPFRYEGAVRQAILALKYGGIKAAAPQLGLMMAEYLSAVDVPGDVLAPVPMHGQRRRERGYNQAELLSREISRNTGLRHENGLLMRTRHVEPQARTTEGIQRRSMLRTAWRYRRVCDWMAAPLFWWTMWRLPGAQWMFARKALKGAGAESVWGLVLAVAGGNTPTE